jgi:hypothetical protein
MLLQRLARVSSARIPVIQAEGHATDPIAPGVPNSAGLYNTRP